MRSFHYDERDLVRDTLRLETWTLFGAMEYGLFEESRTMSVAGSRTFSRGLFASPFSIRFSRTSTAWYPISNVGCTTDVMPGRKKSSAVTSSNVTNEKSFGVLKPTAYKLRSAASPVTPFVANSADGLSAGRSKPFWHTLAICSCSKLPLQISEFRTGMPPF